MLAAFLAAARSIPFRYCLPPASSSHQRGLPPILWMYLLLPGHLTPITVNPPILSYSRCLLGWKLMWHWNFILVYIFLCVGKLGTRSKICSASFPVSFGRNKWTLDNTMCPRPSLKAAVFYCTLVLFYLNFAFRHTNIFKSIFCPVLVHLSPFRGILLGLDGFVVIRKQVKAGDGVL